MQIQLTSEITEPYSRRSVISGLLASERSERDTLRSVQLRIAYILLYIMVSAILFL